MIYWKKDFLIQDLLFIYMLSFKCKTYYNMSKIRLFNHFIKFWTFCENTLNYWFDCTFRFPWTWCLDTPLNWELRLRDKESLPWSTVNTAPPRRRPSTSWPRAWTPTRRRIPRKRSAGKTDNSVPRILISLFMCRTDIVIQEVQRQIFLNESEVECDNYSCERWNISIKLWNMMVFYCYKVCWIWLCMSGSRWKRLSYTESWRLLKISLLTACLKGRSQCST